MIIQHQDNVAAFAGGHTYWWLPRQIIVGPITVTSIAFTAIGKLFLFTASEWVSPVVFHLETTFRATSCTVYVRLFDETAAAAVMNSQVSTASSTVARYRSASAMTLVDGHEYRIQVGVDGGAAGAILGASVIALTP